MILPWENPQKKTKDKGKEKQGEKTVERLYGYYNPETNLVKAFPMRSKESFIRPGGWECGTGRLLVSEHEFKAEPAHKACLHLVDVSGKILRTKMYPHGDYKFELTRQGLLFYKENHFDSLGAEGIAIPWVKEECWDKKSPEKISAPKDHTIIGWSRDVRFIAVAPVRKDLLFPLRPEVVHENYIVHATMKFEREHKKQRGKAKTKSSAGLSISFSEPPEITAEHKAMASTAPVPLILWDRISGERREFMKIPVDEIQGNDGNTYNVCPKVDLYFSDQGVTVFISREAAANRTASAKIRHYDPKKKTCRQIALKAKCLNVEVITPDGSRFVVLKDFIEDQCDGWFLARLTAEELKSFFSDIPIQDAREFISELKPETARKILAKLPPEKACKLESAVAKKAKVAQKRMLFLIEPAKGTDRELPISSKAIKLMQDGRILCVIKDSLVLYNPDTGAKKIVVKNLYSAWKNLGK